MKKNMGGIDKTIRVLIAIAIGILIYTNVFTGTWAIILGVIAVVFLITSFFSFCPLYTLFGASTCGKSK